MTRWKFSFEHTYVYVAEIDAPTEDEAYEIGWREYEEGNIDPAFDDFYNVELEEM